MDNFSVDTLNDIVNSSYFIVSVMALFIFSSLLYISQLLKQERFHEKIERERAIEDQAKKDFISNINHEVRTPVNVITGMLHLLNSQEVSRQAEEYIKKIKIANADIKNVLDDTLDFNKIYGEGIVCKNKEIDFFNFIDNLKNKFTLLAEQKRLTISFLVDEKVPRRIKVDEYLLKSICQKLLDNAIKFTDKGHISFKIDMLQGNDSVVKLDFQISDTGVGMSKSQINSVSKAFIQGDGSKSRNYGGIGIGIFLTKKMLTVMDSKLTIESSVDVGTRVGFSIMLDYIMDDLSEEEICKGKKVLFVDDDIINRGIGQTLLNKLEIDVDVYASGKEAVAHVNDTFDALILDIKMPDMDGIEVAINVREQGYKDIPIIALTANSSEADVEEYKQAGMVACLEKPINFDLLKKTLAAVFNSKGRDIEFSNLNNEQDFASALSFDETKGLRLINNDKELFYGILEKFKTNFSNLEERLNSLMAIKDFKTCEILVHSIKGIAINVGAMPLSKIAKELEAQFKSRKHANIIDFIVELNIVITEIAKYLELHSDDSGEDGVEGKKKTGGIKELKNLLTSLQEAIVNNDPVNSKSILKEINLYSFSDTLKDTLGSLKKSISYYDFDESAKIVEGILKNLGGK